MRSLALCCSLLILAGCARPDNRGTADSTAAVSAPISLAAVAGTWRVKGTNEAGDSVVGYTLTATADPAGWTMTFPGRPPIPIRITVSGDSLITDAGPYESVLRRGVQVRTNGAFRLVGGKLVGSTMAHYAVTTADSTLRIRSEGERVPQ